MAEARNYEEYRRQVLEELGVEYVLEDIRNFERWRLKVLEGLKDFFPTEQVETAVSNWLDDHPEATTTITDGAVTTAKVADGSVTDAKLDSNGIKAEVTDIRVGADGVTYASAGDAVRGQISPHLDYGFKDVDVTLTNDKAINGDRAIVSGTGTIYSISDIIPVSAGDIYEYDAYMHWGNYFYVFYDSNNTAFGGVKSENTGTVQHLESELIVIPSNAVGIRLGMIVNATRNYSFKKRTTLLVADELSDDLSEELDGKYEIKQKWSGKTWVAIGDSMTGSNATASKKYHALIAEETGITVLNYGKDGTGYGKVYSTNNNFCDRVLELENVDCDVITVFGSFNDSNIELGTADDTGTDTIGGYMNTTFDRLYSVKPFVSVGVILPTPWWGRTPDGGTENRNKAIAYCNMLLEICRKRSIPVLDLFHNSNFHPNEENFRNEFFYQADGVHPNNKGHKKIAPMILNFLEQIIEL